MMAAAQRRATGIPRAEGRATRGLLRRPQELGGVHGGDAPAGLPRRRCDPARLALHDHRRDRPRQDGDRASARGLCRPRLAVLRAGRAAGLGPVLGRRKPRQREIPVVRPVRRSRHKARQPADALALRSLWARCRGRAARPRRPVAPRPAPRRRRHAAGVLRRRRRQQQHRDARGGAQLPHPDAAAEPPDGPGPGAPDQERPPRRAPASGRLGVPERGRRQPHGVAQRGRSRPCTGRASTAARRSIRCASSWCGPNRRGLSTRKAGRCPAPSPGRC